MCSLSCVLSAVMFREQRTKSIVFIYDESLGVKVLMKYWWSNLEISEYCLICLDHPPNKNHGSICIYYSNFLLLKLSGIHILMRVLLPNWKSLINLAVLSRIIDHPVFFTMTLLFFFFQVTFNWLSERKLQKSYWPNFYFAAQPISWMKH